MNVAPAAGEGGADVRSKVTALTDALTSERGLLDELARVLVAQRDGISSDDLQALDESVFAAQRVFRTLGEARQRRRTLLQLVGADADLRLGELEAVLGPGATPELCAARDRLLESAARLARELTTNRAVIDGVMSVGDRLLEAFMGVQGTAMYDRAAETKSAANAGAIVNTRA